MAKYWTWVIEYAGSFCILEPQNALFPTDAGNTYASSQKDVKQSCVCSTT